MRTCKIFLYDKSYSDLVHKTTIEVGEDDDIKTIRWNEMWFDLEGCGTGADGVEICEYFPKQIFLRERPSQDLD
ncbi:hypothetical protein PHIM7_356 [Sinorhizobium phage phiM7]|uniref:Uncharacterized protein n=1 Tax=Sinorhizobium phage phiM7 TaxID=1647403 RepID=A0A0F6WC01_9CAUD|nr:hypothetical protein FDH46_gp122 [Sinorhizobium phage phiM7]AKF12901.1 hypothetical protein PHIM7_356 [Sinorhizobium phage phiM7]AKF13261.1 hypothetical protein PHIM19_356 [Sinorhizobium phage phiM19]